MFPTRLRPKYVLQFIIQVEATAQFAPTTTTVPDERNVTALANGLDLKSVRATINGRHSGNRVAGSVSQVGLCSIRWTVL